MKYQKGNDDFTKVSVNISNDVLVAMDSYAEQMGVSRSAVFNIWLRRGALFEDEMIRSMGKQKRLRRIENITSEKFLERLNENLLRAGNFKGGSDPAQRDYEYMLFYAARIVSEAAAKEEAQREAFFARQKAK